MKSIEYESIETPFTHWGHPVWDILSYGFLILVLISMLLSMKD